MPCPFCTLPPERIIDENEHAVWIYDGFPLSPGHSLIIPKRHIGSFFEITTAEKIAIFNLLDLAKNVVSTEHLPNAYNIGVNDGPAAGQTVPHLHVHLIPRYINDVKDPRGGVRWVIPEKAVYWADS
jgi:diadenosine tetraphosphate (Ap4A) HIT family hydrolase